MTARQNDLTVHSFTFLWSWLSLPLSSRGDALDSFVPTRFVVIRHFPAGRFTRTSFIEFTVLQTFHQLTQTDDVGVVSCARGEIIPWCRDCKSALCRDAQQCCGPVAQVMSSFFSVLGTRRRGYAFCWNVSCKAAWFQIFKQRSVWCYVHFLSSAWAHFRLIDYLTVFRGFVDKYLRDTVKHRGFFLRIDVY
jgi:hypothetical protein